jgi:lipopolysaccharide transport system ATP-binding protein
MSDTIIQVDRLSKRYRLGSIGARTLRSDVSRRWAKLRGKPDPLAKIGQQAIGKSVNHNGNASDELWALKDVSFEVKQGDVLGIVGRNGAGKSTLLKILSRVTAPTCGEVRVKGRIASLLEVGTGFHPELTGRENIFLNGAVLGMTTAEIRGKFDEIVDFSGVEKFIDTPVKRYSSGMYVRLAFAVAAHLDPEILIIDEVLAVGDAAFQKKCFGKIGEATRGGRTVLFVSHQMNQIRRLCESVIWLDGGRIQEVGKTAEVLSAYEAAMSCDQTTGRERPDKPTEKARFLRWEIAEPAAQKPNLLTTLGSVSIRVFLKVNKPLRGCHHGINLWGQDGQVLWGWAANNLSFDEGIYELVYKLPSLPLRPGAYTIHTSLYDENGLVDVWYWIPELAVATIPQTHSNDFWSGILNIPCEFNPRKINELSETQ